MLGGDFRAAISNNVKLRFTWYFNVTNMDHLKLGPIKYQIDTYYLPKDEITWCKLLNLDTNRG